MKNEWPPRSSARQKWLTDLLFALTVFARGTYTVGGNGLDDPERMRRFNELMHRTASQLRSELSGSRERPGDIFGAIVSNEAEALGFTAADLRSHVGYHLLDFDAAPGVQPRLKERSGEC